MTQVSQDLEKAVEVLDQHDWCQGQFKQADGKVCSKGAVLMAVGVEFDEYGSPHGIGYGPACLHAANAAKWNRYANAIQALVEVVPTEAWEALKADRSARCPVIYYNDRFPGVGVEDIKLMFKRAIEVENAK